MLEVYLIRHAIAAERGAEWPDDDLRPLTRQGVRRFKEVVNGLRSLDIELELVLTSPLTRARQTAELVSLGLSTRPIIRVTTALSPGAQFGEVVSALGIGARHVALVGHEPDLGRLAATLIGARRPLAFKKGGVCRIDVREGARPRGTLVWFATPGLLRRIGSA